MIFNRTNWEHGLLSLAAYAVLFSIFSNPIIAATAPIAFFLGREHAQFEYKIGDPSKLVGYEAFDFRKWSLDAKLDLIFPVIFCTAAALLTFLILG